MIDSTKTDKNTRILKLYHQLINGQYVDKSLFSWENGINERSFDRDIEDLRLFLSEIHTSRELLYDKINNVYYLTGDTPVFMERMDAAVIAKILLESHVLRDDEIMGLFDALLKTTVPKDATAIKDYLKHDALQYQSDIKVPIMKLLGDIYAVIDSGTDIELTIHTIERDSYTIKVSPLEISMKDGHFYLIAAENKSISDISQFLIEDIECFTTLPTTYAEQLQYQYHSRHK